MCTAVCVLRTYLPATYSYYSTGILFIPNVAHMRSETFTALLCRRLHFLASFFFAPRLLALCAAVRPCVCYQAVSGWVEGSREKLQEMGCLRAREFDIISIWTSGGQSRSWIGPAEAQVSERLSLWRKESMSTTRRWDTQRECRARRCAQVQALLVMTCREEASPTLTLRRFSLAVLVSPLLPLFLACKEETAVQCFLTQKCQENRLHLAAVVYNALWSRLIGSCDTPRLFLFPLLGIWMIKEQCLKGAFSFSISSTSTFQREAHLGLFAT